MGTPRWLRLVGRSRSPYEVAVIAGYPEARLRVPGTQPCVNRARLSAGVVLAAVEQGCDKCQGGVVGRRATALSICAETSAGPRSCVVLRRRAEVRPRSRARSSVRSDEIVSAISSSEAGSGSRGRLKNHAAARSTTSDNQLDLCAPARSDF
jgi:hypothetical protein